MERYLNSIKSKMGEDPFLHQHGWFHVISQDSQHQATPSQETRGKFPILTPSKYWK